MPSLCLHLPHLMRPYVTPSLWRSAALMSSAAAGEEVECIGAGHAGAAGMRLGASKARRQRWAALLRCSHQPVFNTRPEIKNTMMMLISWIRCTSPFMICVQGGDYVAVCACAAAAGTAEAAAGGGGGWRRRHRRGIAPDWAPPHWQCDPK